MKKKHFCLSIPELGITLSPLIFFSYFFPKIFDSRLTNGNKTSGVKKDIALMDSLHVIFQSSVFRKRLSVVLFGI
jgi:hypothetical protein